jgi:hypothetical protein
MIVRLGLVLLAVVLVLVAAATLRDRTPSVSASQAADAAFRWVGVGAVETPRHDGEAWEVDVARPDGSLVEVTIGDRLELRGLDEELGPDRRPAHDELTGRVRERAIRAAMAVTGPGRVLGVERDSGREGEVTEVDIRRPDGAAVEVGLDSRRRVIEVEPQDRDDE